MKHNLFRPARILIATIVALLLAGLAVGAGGASAAPYGKTSPRIGVFDPGPCAGSYVTASGNGFQAGESIAVFRDTTQVGTVTASAAGTFSLRVDIDRASVGAHQVSASGSVTGVSATSGFTVSTQTCGSNSTTAPAPATAVSSNGLAFTGAPTIALAVVAVLALLGGIVLVVAGRRRA